MDQSSARELIGHVLLDNYLIEDVLGQGGMSVVYRARHRLTEQIVALKVLPPELAIHATLKSRFLEEARALAKLEHPSIVRLYAFGEDRGRFVLAMQYVEGQTLERRVIKHKRLDWREVGRIALSVLDALEVAHEQGVVHRDIKPSNVLVRNDGRVVVMDFGIAKMSSGAMSSGRLTATGQTMGTVRYMSPEQVRGEDVDTRSDLYALGVTMWEAIEGDTPFEGATHFEIMSKHLMSPVPSLSERGVEVPAAFEQVLQKAMGKTREGRFQTAAEFRAALRAVLGGGEIDLVLEVTPVPVFDKTSTTRTLGAEVGSATRRSRLALLLGAAVVAAAGAVLGVVLMKDGGRGDTTAGAGAKPVVGASATPEPLLVQGLQPRTDQIVAGDVPLRVLAARSLDADVVARAYAGARGRFVRFLEGRGIAQVAPPVAVNLVVAPAGVMCAPELYPDGPPPAECGKQPYRFASARRTLYVLDGPELEGRNLLQAASFVACISDETLLEKGCLKRENLLGAFWKDALPLAGGPDGGQAKPR